MAVKTISPSADARETWRTVNALIAEVGQLRWVVAQQSAMLEALKRRPLGGGGGMNWIGEWTANTAYSMFDVVVISSQPNMGTYIATADIPDTADPPYAGGDWAQFPFSEVGVWT